jgi:hypothetical protein
MMASVKRRVALTFGILVVSFGGAASDAAAQSVAAWEDGAQVLLTAAQAVREVFPGAAAYRMHAFAPTPAQREWLEETLGRRLFEPEYRFLLVYDAAGRLQGYALVTEERGKYRPITFMVGVTPDFRVAGAAVMVYRESRGGEVQRGRFLSQYRGKTLRDPIQINRDIINISGATISVRSMNAGVRKTLAVAQLAFASGAPAGEAPSPLSTLR